MGVIIAQIAVPIFTSPEEVQGILLFDEAVAEVARDKAVEEARDRVLDRLGQIARIPAPFIAAAVEVLSDPPPLGAGEEDAISDQLDRAAAAQAAARRAVSGVQQPMHRADP